MCRAADPHVSLLRTRLTPDDVRLAALGAGLVLLILPGLALHQPGADDIHPLWRVYVFVGLILAGAALYALAIRRVLAAPPPHALPIVLAVAVILRVLVLPASPFLSSDIYRYVWDGRVQQAGINPYRFIPADPALAALRDGAIYPHVNRRTYARTIYPPMAQLLFRLVAALGDSVVAMKAACVGFEALAVWAMIRLLRIARLPTARVLIYAWNPLAVWAFAGNGHVDGFAVGLLGLALLLRGQRRDGLAGAALAGAALVKFLPAVMLPALWRRWRWRLPAAFAATVVVLYGLYIDAGWNVLGFLPGYGQEEGLDRTGFYALAALSALVEPPSWVAHAYVALAAVGLLALGLRIGLATTLPDPAHDAVRVCRHAALLGAAVIVAISPHYAWYFPWLALPCCVCPLPSVIFLSVVPAIEYLNPWNERLIWPSLIYIPFALLAWRDLRLARHGPQRNTACQLPA